MDRFGPTGKVSKKQVHLLRWSSFPGRTGLNFGWMDRALSEGYSRAKLCIDYFSWTWELFKNAKNADACALRDCLGVSRPFVSETSPKCIDREGLKRRRTRDEASQKRPKTTTSSMLNLSNPFKPPKNSTWPCLNGNPTHFIHEMKTKGDDAIEFYEFLPSLMRFLPTKRSNRCALYYSGDEAHTSPLCD